MTAPRLAFTRAGVFYTAHGGKTFPENFSDVDMYLAYASLDVDGNIWRFEDGSSLRPMCRLNQRWAADGRPVIVLIPTED